MPISYNYSLFDEPKKEAPAAPEVSQKDPAICDTPTPESMPESAGKPEEPLDKPADPLPDLSESPDKTPEAITLDEPVEWTSGLRGLRNLTDVAVSFTDARPWDWDSEPPEKVLTDKSTFQAWSKRPDTEHLFFTGVEGRNPVIRIGKENPPEVLHAVIAEYDGIVTDENIDNIKSKLPAGLMPTYVGFSRFSGGCRLVWMLKNPLNVGSGQLCVAFLRHAGQELRLKLLAPGLDEECLKPKQTFEVGVRWRKIGGPLADETVAAWLFKASLRSDAKLSEGIKESMEIPLVEVEKEVEKQFPGRWKGRFEIGQRGVVFFDPTSVNPSAAIVTADGMVCFGQPKSFYPWAEIFGSEFTRKYNENQIALATSRVYHDGKMAYIKRDGKSWTSMRDVYLDLYFSQECRLSAESSKAAKWFVVDSKRIDNAVPFVGDHREIVSYNGKFLNTWEPNILQPAPGIAGEWGDGFGWLANFFETRVDRAVDPEGFSMWHLMAWWQYFYRNLMEGTCSNGQAIAIAGGQSIGKTLFLDKMLGRSVGGHTDAASYLQANTTFNSQLFDSAVWAIDDGTFASNEEGRQRFAQMMKKSAATGHYEYHAKGSAAAQVCWWGRAVILLNTDPASIEAIPTLGLSNEDKLNVYRWVETAPAFPERGVLEKIIEDELPFLLRWLLAFDPTSKKIELDPRFGIKSYIERKTREEAEDASGVGAFCQVLAEMVAAGDMRGTVQLNATTLLMRLCVMESMRAIVSRFSPQYVSRLLRSLSSRRDSVVKKYAGKVGWWEIDCDKVRSLYGHPSPVTSGVTVDLGDK
jgi:hypothetical protein